MKKYIFNILLILFFVGHAQENKIYIEYEHGQWSPNFNTTEILIANNKSAKYEVKEISSIEKNKRGYTDKNGVMNMLPFNSVKKTTLYKNKDDDFIYFNKYMDNEEKEWFINDSISKQEWQIVPGQTKKILGYNCEMAKLKFRGSTFIAYFTNEIKIPFGPWKFKNSPGVILEITLVDKPIFYWKAKKIIYPYKNKTNFNFDKSKYTTTYQYFIKEEDNLREKKEKKIMNKYKHLGTSSYSYTRIGLEKLFEWEVQ